MSGEHGHPVGCAGANSQGFHIEQCGFASWSKARWLLHQPMLHRTAYKTALHCKLFPIPVRLVYAAELAATHRAASGVTTHWEVTKSGIGGPTSTHTDPGSGYPLGYVITFAKMYLKAMG